MWSVSLRGAAEPARGDILSLNASLSDIAAHHTSCGESTRSAQSRQLSLLRDRTKLYATGSSSSAGSLPSGQIGTRTRTSSYMLLHTTVVVYSSIYMYFSDGTGHTGRTGTGVSTYYPLNFIRFIVRRVFSTVQYMYYEYGRDRLRQR